MKINLNNKKALVGGSSKGLGYAVAKQLASCGAIVTMVSRNESLSVSYTHLTLPTKRIV